VASILSFPHAGENFRSEFICEVIRRKPADDLVGEFDGPSVFAMVEAKSAFEFHALLELVLAQKLLQAGNEPESAGLVAGGPHAEIKRLFAVHGKIH
jgi:hypothetical protein